ncbi:MAG: hypothetical protein LM567_03900 [Desulfurococcaceae archaeon]|nr:hypothetical protein [Desulfurococcaceae archaeon]
MKVIEFRDVKNLDLFIKRLIELGFRIELGPHVVLEDHSELAVFKAMRDNELEAYIVAHYITQYYRAVLSNSYSDDSLFVKELLRIKYSGEKWSIPVNPLYIVTLNSKLLEYIKDYRDEYPVPDGEYLINTYRSKNPEYAQIPRVVIGRLVDVES